MKRFLPREPRGVVEVFSGPDSALEGALRSRNPEEVRALPYDAEQQEGERFGRPLAVKAREAHPR